jgi:hypothetical protein
MVVTCPDFRASFGCNGSISVVLGYDLFFPDFRASYDRYDLFAFLKNPGKETPGFTRSPRRQGRQTENELVVSARARWSQAFVLAVKF